MKPLKRIISVWLNCQLNVEINKTQIVENIIVESRPFHCTRATDDGGQFSPSTAFNRTQLCIVPLETFIYGNFKLCDCPPAIRCWHVSLLQVSNLYRCFCIGPMIANRLLLNLSRFTDSNIPH